MTDHDPCDLLERLCLAPGPPGAEDAVRAIVRERLDGVGQILHDRLWIACRSILLFPGQAIAHRYQSFTERPIESIRHILG